MKTSKLFALFAFAFALLAASWSWAQSQKSPKATSRIPIDQFEALMLHLQDTKQTNSLRLFNEFSNASSASRDSADLGVTLRILMELREGRTEMPIQLLEQRLTSDVVGFFASYRELPVPVQESFSVSILGHAREYCRKYKVTTGDTEVDQFIAKAFQLADKQRK